MICLRKHGMKTHDFKIGANLAACFISSALKTEVADDCEDATEIMRSFCGLGFFVLVGYADPF